MRPHARAALADLERARTAAAQASGSITGEVWLATVYSMSLGVLPPEATVLSGARRVRIDRLGDVDWVHYAAGNGLAEIVDATWSTAGIRPAVAVRTEQASAAVALSAAGLGPALVPANLVPVEFVGRVLRPDPPVSRELCTYAHAEPDRLTEAMAETLMRFADLLPEHVRAELEGSTTDGLPGHLLAICYHGDMPGVLYIRDVDDDVIDDLKARAREAHMSLSAYAARELAKVVERPSNAEVVRRARRRVEGHGLTTDEVVAAVHASRDERDTCR